MLGTYEIAREHFGLGVAAAALASAVPESMVKGPLETLKNLSQTAVRPVSLPATLFRGTAAMLLREVPGNVAYFWTYERIRGEGRHASHWTRSPLLAGVGAGAAFALAVYPIDSIRAQVVTGCQWRDVRPSYRGFGPYIVRAMAITGALFGTYERVRRGVANDDARHDA